MAVIETLFMSYLGKYQITTPLPSSDKKLSQMTFGGIEDIGKDSPLQDRKLNAPNILYQIGFIDEDTIEIILEKPCSNNSFVITETAVRSILKRGE